MTDEPPRRLAVRVAIAFAAVAGGTSVALLPICDLLFDCGCSWPWTGGVAHCNVFQHGVPHCPWCAYPRSADLSLAALLGAQGLGAWAVARRRPGVLLPLVGSLMAGTATALVLRHVVAWWAGYPL